MFSFNEWSTKKVQIGPIIYDVHIYIYDLKKLTIKIIYQSKSIYHERKTIP